MPFEGDSGVFRLQPSSCTMNPPRGHVHGTELLLRFTRTDHNHAAIKSEFDRQVSCVKDYLGSAGVDLQTFNGSVRAQAGGRLAARRTKLPADRHLVEALGFPLIRRNDPPAVRPVEEVSALPPGTPPVQDVDGSTAGESDARG